MKALTLVALALLAACGPRPAEEPPAAEAPRPEAPAAGPDLPPGRAGDVLRRAIDYHGGWAAWAAKRTVEFDKRTTRYRPDGTVESTRPQHHRYVLRPELAARIEWEEDGRKVVLLNRGGDAWRIVDGRVAPAPEDRNGARNSTFGSHYVFNMPWKLADPGARLADAGRETLADGTVLDKLRVTYEAGAGDAAGLHTWTYYFDAETGRLAANHLEFGPGEHDYTEYHDDREIAGLRVAARRHGYAADAEGKRGPKISEIVYDDVRFDVPLEEDLFRPPGER